MALPDTGLERTAAAPTVSASPAPAPAASTAGPPPAAASAPPAAVARQPATPPAPFSIACEAATWSWLGPDKLPKAVQSRPYRPDQPIRFVVSGGKEADKPYKFSIDTELKDIFNFSRRLPTGLALTTDEDGLGCRLEGTPQQGGTYTFIVKAEDNKGRIATREYAIAIELDLDDFVSYFDASPAASGAEATTGAPQISAFALEHLGDQRFPLAFCEFLAYKAAQAYLEPERTLRDDLKRAHPGEQLTHIAVFDSRNPPLRYDESRKAEQDAGVPARWLTGDEKADRKRVKAIDKRRAELDTQAFGFVFEGRTFIVCRGTTSIRDWRVDVDSILTTEGSRQLSFGEKALSLIGLRDKPTIMTPEEEILIGPDRLEPARAVGFAAAWGAIADQVEHWLTGIPEQYRQEYVFSGHSLGGALAFIGAHDFASRGRRIHAVVTFGAPCVGQAALEAEKGKSPKHFVDHYNELQGGELARRTFRVETSNDLVPKIAHINGFSHVGRSLAVDFPPLPGPFSRFRRKWVVPPLLFAAKTLLSFQSKEWWALPTKTFGNMLVHVVPFGRKLLAAHAARDQYAMFLSTLAYRKLRQQHVAADLAALDGENPELHQKYEHANRLLQAHLQLVRGPDDKHNRQPILVTTPKQELKLSRKYYGSSRTDYIF